MRHNRLVDIDGERERWSQHEHEHGYIRARLRLLKPVEGGRHTPIFTGYRSHWAFPPEIHNERHDAPLLIEDSDALGLGEEAIVRLHPLAPQLWPTLHEGDQLEMLEGARLFGVANVVETVAANDS